MDHRVFLHKARNQDPQYMATDSQQIYKAASGKLSPESSTHFLIETAETKINYLILKLKYCVLRTSPSGTRETSFSFT